MARMVNLCPTLGGQVPLFSLRPKMWNRVCLLALPPAWVSVLDLGVTFGHEV